MVDIKLGLKIRNIRNSRKTTLQELAKITELTSSFISQVERGIVSPSVDSLRKITRALGVGIGEFFEEDMREFTFIRKNKGPGVVDKETKSSYETLVSDLLNIKMKPSIIKLQKGGEVKKEFLLEENDAFLIVTEGEIELGLDGEKFVLSKGDSFYCKGRRRPQRIVNSSNEEAMFLWIKSIK